MSEEKKKIDWGKMDASFDFTGIDEKVKEASGGGGDFPEIPDDTYEVEVEKLELTTSKKGDPMLSIWFKILEGEFKGSRLFYNKVMQPQNDRAFGFQVHQNNIMLRDLSDWEEDEVEFENLKQYDQLILDIAESIDEDNLEYLLEKGTNKGGYDTFKIVEILE
ncbi:DUF669 domain-containing protein [Listeria monocytogenes]|uniref:DUF669 domain-containing protein n=1 Tax=Listeria cossartiae TaxID=2838249 RepID=UPI001626EEEF|nr:DUF669 domain-containing protein [Listeria cossartiae]EAF2286805.1 DUF669 domain-containing protein [Listeria monocytogenes]MBC1548816.1 DUF669 domain-containing protein [Listeria cossartiae subsp. cossartiae]